MVVCTYKGSLRLLASGYYYTMDPLTCICGCAVLCLAVVIMFRIASSSCPLKLTRQLGCSCNCDIDSIHIMSLTRRGISPVATTSYMYPFSFVSHTHTPHVTIGLTMYEVSLLTDICRYQCCSQGVGLCGRLFLSFRRY